MICIILRIFFLSMIMIIILFTFTFCPLLQLLKCFKLFGQTGFASENLRIVLKSSRKLAMIWKNPDFLKPSGKLTIIWKSLDNFETVWKIGSYLDKSEQFWNRPETGNHLENSGSFWKHWDAQVFLPLPCNLFNGCKQIGKAKPTPRNISKRQLCFTSAQMAKYVLAETHWKLLTFLFSSRLYQCILFEQNKRFLTLTFFVVY